jgi:plastocyanin
VKRVLAAVLTGSLLAAAAAYADETITARPRDEFASARTTIDQGEKVTLRNSDISGHDVTSSRKSDDGKPLFQSELVAPGSSGPVEGTEYLTTGSYPFVCTVHPGMDATLVVTTAGTPVPRPDPPRLTIKVASGDLQRVVKRGKLKLRVTSTKAEVKLVARTKSRRLGRKTVDFGSAGSKTVTLSLSKAARNALRDRSSAKVTATGTATDAAGQADQATASRTLK